VSLNAKKCLSDWHKFGTVFFFAYSVASWIIFIRVRVLSENKISCAY